MRKVITLLSVISFMGISCEEVIDINLNDTAPGLVAEANIRLYQPCTVRLSYTSNYFDTLHSVVEENAIITISDSEERSEVLTYQGDGLYRGETVNGLPGHTFTLTISSGNNEYLARSSLFSQPELIELEYEELDIPHQLEETIYTVKCVMVDDIYNENYYLFRYFRNGVLLNDYFSTYSDRFIDEDTVVYNDFRLDFYMGDTVRVELHSIDREVYNYFNLMNDMLFSAMTSSTPFNPASNFSNGLIGYFMASSYDSESIIIR